MSVVRNELGRKKARIIVEAAAGYYSRQQGLRLPAKWRMRQVVNQIAKYDERQVDAIVNTVERFLLIEMDRRLFVTD